MSIQDLPPLTLLWRSWILFLAIAATGTGCSRPNPTPELLDPVFADLQQKVAATKAESERVKKEVEELKASYSKLQPRDPTRRKAQQDIKKGEDNLIHLEQQALYFEIRAEKRRDYAREDYLKAFNADKPWPDKADFEAYKLSEKLRTSSRDWGTRVPRTDRYNKKGADFEKKKLEEALKNAGPAAAPNH